jgi:hypothetical protein
MMIGYEHTGVRNIVQGVLLGHLLHTISYTMPPLPTGPPQKKETPRWTVLYRITRQLLHLSEAGVLVRKFRQANPAQLS